MRTGLAACLLCLGLAAPPAASGEPPEVQRGGCSRDCIAAGSAERPDSAKEYYVSCAPRRGRAVTVLASPAPDDPVRDAWTDTVGAAWSFQVDRFLTVDGVQLAAGILVDGRGRWREATRYVIAAEWDCSLYRD